MFRVVQVETTTFCNAHCQFCPHDRMKSFSTMGEELYKKIVLDAAQYNITRFIPMLSGEPFMDPDIVERIEFARKVLKPATEIRLFTNGSLVTEKHIDRLSMVRNFKLSFSLNGPTPAIRKDLMGLGDWDKVVQMIRYTRDKGILWQNTTVWMPYITAHELNGLAIVPLAGVTTFHNWCGDIYQYIRTRPTDCERMRDDMTIQVNGNAPVCCFDMFGQTSFGNAKTMTLKEIFDSPLKQEYLLAHSKQRGQDMPRCHNCI